MRGIKRRTEGQATAEFYAACGLKMLRYQLERAKINTRVGLYQHRVHRSEHALADAMSDLHLALMIHQQLKEKHYAL